MRNCYSKHYLNFHVFQLRNLNKYIDRSKNSSVALVIALKQIKKKNNNNGFRQKPHRIKERGNQTQLKPQQEMWGKQRSARSWNNHHSHLRWPEAHGGIHSQGEPLGASIFFLLRRHISHVNHRRFQTTIMQYFLNSKNVYLCNLGILFFIRQITRSQHQMRLFLVLFYLKRQLIY